MDFVVKNKIEITEDKEFRYLLKVPFTNTPQNSALIILKNPSVATGSQSDHTINRICNYCEMVHCCGCTILSRGNNWIPTCYLLSKISLSENVRSLKTILL